MKKKGKKSGLLSALLEWFLLSSNWKRGKILKKRGKVEISKRQKWSKLKHMLKLKITLVILHLFFRTTLGYLICTFHAEIFVKNQSCFTKGFDIDYITDFDGKIFVKTVWGSHPMQTEHVGGRLKLSITIQNVHPTWWAQASTRSWRWIHFLATCMKLNGESRGIYQTLQLCFPSLTRPLGAWVVFCGKARCR